MQQKGTLSERAARGGTGPRAQRLKAPPAGPGWDRLAQEVRDARAAAGIATADDLARAAGLSTPTVVKVEEGARVSAASLRAIDAALGWPPGASERLAAGGDPHLAIPTVHRYVSTYCQHAQCGDCRLSCKVCGAPCLCPCGHPGP